MRASKQIFRCYPVPNPEETGSRWNVDEFIADSDIAAEIARVGNPWAGPMLLLDCETLTGAKDGQGSRFGYFQERGYRYERRVADAAKRILTRDKLDTLWHHGLIYEAKNCLEEEIEVLEWYSDQYGVDLYTRAEFVRDILYRGYYVKWANKWEDRLREPCYVIGHNLPFDLGALAVHCGLARKDLYGGLSLVMSGSEHDPVAETEEAYAARLEEWRQVNQGQVALLLGLGDETAANEMKMRPEPQRRRTVDRRVAIKKLGFGKHLYRGSKQSNGMMVNEAGETKPNFMELVHYLDTQTLGRALLGPGSSSMQSLLHRLNVPKEYRKGVADYHGPITPEYIGYCRDDVENTWQIFKAERELYKQAGLSKPLHKLYSEASVGKAFEEAFGIRGFNELNPHFDPIVLGCIMEGYYGGQSDVRVRHEPVEVIHCDLKSQYPTVNILMVLQELLIAGQIGVRRDDPEARRFLETAGLNDLQLKDTWRMLRGVALIAPEDDILPFRAQYGEREEDGSLNVNIGVNRVVSACPAWYTFADIIKSRLLTGKTPKILKTLELVPIGKQHTNVMNLYGQEQFKVDLAHDDFFKTMIDMRIDAEAERDNELTPDDRKAFMDAFQNGLKIAANGTSYGVPNEFIVDDHLAEVPTTVYFGGLPARVKARAHSIGADGDEIISDYKAEKPGKYYGPWGVLIPAAGRLFLGIAERLAMDRGLTYCFCDTDSMAFCDYHGRYSRKEFRAKVKEVTDWFQPLNPYKHDVRLFGYEKVNYKLKDYKTGEIVKGTFEPLYCLAVSSKRYCLFNLVSIDGKIRIVIRKASAHGLGDVMLPTGYKVRFEHLAAPIKTAAEMKEAPNDPYTRKHGKLVAGSAAPLFLDMWYAAILELQEKGNLDDIDKTIGAWPELQAPQHSQTSLSTRDAWLHYQCLPNRRAFQFFETLPAPRLNERGTESTTARSDILDFEMKEAEGHSLYTSFSKPFQLDLDDLYRRDTNEPIKPYLDEGMKLTTIADRVCEYFAHGEAKSEGKVGLLKRKCVAGLSKVWTGKESRPLADVEDLPDDETLEHYKSGAEIVEAGLNHELIATAGIAEVAKAARIDEDVLVDVVMGRKSLRPDLMDRLSQTLTVNKEGRVEVVDIPVTRKEKTIERVHHVLKKHKQLRELGKFIHAMKLIERRPEGSRLDEVEQGSGRRVETQPENEKITHKQILNDLGQVIFLCPPRFLKLADMETYARKFYGIEKRLSKKADRKVEQNKFFNSTAHNKGTRWRKSRARGRDDEIGRIAEVWGLPEIKGVNNVKRAHLLDKDLIKNAKFIEPLKMKVVRIVSYTQIAGMPAE